MRTCLFCDSLLSEGESSYCSYQHKTWFEKYRKRIWQMKTIDLEGLRWGAIGRNSSYAAMMEVHKLFNPNNITYNA